MSVLLVQDEPGIRGPLRDQLHNQGVGVTAAGSVGDALAALERQSFAVVVVDLTLPDGSGLEVLDGLRRLASGAHVIVLSGSTAEDVRVEALGRGADDYVVKPFLVRELTARVLAVRRRRDPHRDARLQVGSLTIDLRARQVRIDDRRLELAGKEFDLLAYLAARPGHAFSRDQLLRAVWQSQADWQQAATVTEHIGRLRSKIEIDPRRPQILRTVRGAGYRLDLPSTSAPTDERGPGFAPSTVIHVDGRIVRADRAAGVLLGLADAADLVGRQISELAAPTSTASTRERMGQNPPSPKGRSQLIDLQRSDGTAVSVEVASARIEWNGQPAQRVSFTHVPDLSARLRRLVTGVLTELTDAVIITDLHFHIRSWNTAAERMYGWPEGDVLGRHILDVIQWIGDDGALAATWESLETEGRWKGEGHQLTRDGSVITVLACTTLIRGDSGEPVLIVSVNRATANSTPTVASAGAYDDDQIRTGIANDEFEIYYQPVVQLDDLRVVSMEAVVRWNHPEHGLLAPGAFIDTAERGGSIIELGAVVLEKACAQAVQWQQAGIDVELSVNLSPRQLSDPALFDRITSLLALTGLEPAKLWLEVTETALVEDVDRASEALRRLAELDIGIAIDDFGTGWASLTYLSRFPIHALKIDRSFVAGVGHNANDTAIARSILSLGAELGLTVIAEGIETAAQQTALRKLGCTLGQGYLYGRPTPASTAPTHRARQTEPETGTSPRTTRHTQAATRVAWQPTITPITRLSATGILIPGGPTTNGNATAHSPLVGERLETELITGLLRGLLRADTPHDAAELLHNTIRQMGGLLIPASQADEDALPIDVSLGEGPPLLASIDPSSITRMQLERLLPSMTADAHLAVNGLRRTR